MYSMMKFQECFIKHQETGKPVQKGKQPGPWPDAWLLSTSLRGINRRKIWATFWGNQEKCTLTGGVLEVNGGIVPSTKCICC